MKGFGKEFYYSWGVKNEWAKGPGLWELEGKVGLEERKNSEDPKE